MSIQLSTADITNDQSSTQAPTRYRWYVLCVLIAIYSCHTIDRSVLGVVIQPLKEEFQVSDAALGALAGILYTLAYSITIVPLGYLVDRFNRRNLLAAMLTVWSGLTVFSGLAQNFWTLVLARIGVGAAESGGAPASMSILSDYFPPQQRASAIGIFYLSTAIGIAASFLIGGYVAAEHGWRAAFFVAGAPGLLLAVILLATVREPARGASEQASERQAEAPPLLQAWKSILRRASLRHQLVALLLSAFAASALFTWAATLLVRVHGLDLKQAGLLVALAIGVCQSGGTVIVGRLSDRFGGKSLARLAVAPAIVSVISVPLGLTLALATDSTLAIVALFGTCLVIGAYTAPAYSFGLNLAGPRERGVMMSAIQIAGNLLGVGFGPLCTGLLSDAIGGQRGIALALGAVMLVNLWAAVHYLFAARAVRAEEAIALARA
ncbi:MAG: MFS transporter [Steroidobacteraceae bacterium]